MKHKQLIESLKNYGEITLEDENSIRKYFQFHLVRKNEILIQKGIPCDRLFFVNKGLLRAFHTDEKGQVITRSIAFENTFLTNIVSFRNFGSNIETIECIENAEILYIKKQDFITLISNSNAIKAIYFEILERSNADYVNQLYQLGVSGIHAKIALLKKKYSHLFYRVNDDVLASCIGVSRQHFATYKHLLY